MKAFKSYTCLKIQVDGQPDVGYKRLIKGFFFKKKKRQAWMPKNLVNINFNL